MNWMNNVKPMSIAIAPGILYSMDNMEKREAYPGVGEANTIGTLILSRIITTL